MEQKFENQGKRPRPIGKRKQIGGIFIYLRNSINHIIRNLECSTITKNTTPTNTTVGGR